MEENEFKSTYADYNSNPCAFYKAVLRRCAGCSRAQKVFIAEREAVACKSPGAQQRCKEVVQVMREKALFALKLTHLENALPHGKEIKVECGGLLGLQAAIRPEMQSETVADIHGLLDEAVQRHGSLDRLPYSEVVKFVVHYQSRPKRS